MNAIDVVVPAFNAARYLDEALASILAQDHATNRIIVIDDGSTDGTAEAASRFGARVEIMRRDNGGPGAARNSGIVRSTAAFVAFLDADDRWIARKLTLQMAALNADPAIDLVLCLVRAFASPELPAAERAALEAQQPRPFEGWVPGSMLIRRASFDRVGPFAEDLGVAEGVDWFNRARRAGLSHRVIPEVLLERRLHRHNTTRLHAAGAKCTASRSYLALRRLHSSEDAARFRLLHVTVRVLLQQEPLGDELFRRVLHRTDVTLVRAVAFVERPARIT
jgi:glycosyltransferase involved in cell wall biosynthesis